MAADCAGEERLADQETEDSKPLLSVKYCGGHKGGRNSQSHRRVLWKLQLDLSELVASVSYTHLTLPTKQVQCRSRWSPYH